MTATRAHLNLPPEITSRLRAHRRALRAARAAAALGAAALAAGALLGIALLLDRQLFLTTAARSAITWSAVGLAALAAGAGALWALRPLGWLGVARSLEARHPAFGEALLSSVEIGLLPASARARFAGELLSRLHASTAAELARLPAGPVAEARPARLLLAAAGAVACSLVAAAAIQPTSFRALLDRFLHPGLDLPRPSTVAIEVTPGSARVARGADVEVTARLLRGAPREVVFLARPRGGAWGEVHHQEFVSEPGGTARPAAVHTFRAVRRPFEYRVRSGDFLSPVLAITPREPPRPVAFTVTYAYPAHTGRPPETLARTSGDLAAVRGTVASVAVATSEPVARASIRMEGAAEARELPVVDGKPAAFPVPIESPGSYALSLIALDGVANGGRSRYAIRPLEDAPPRAEIVEPRAAETAIEESGFLDLRWEARDDLGLAEVAVVIKLRDGERPAVVLAAEAGQPAPRQAAGAFRLDPAAIGLGPGEAAGYLLRARDGAGGSGESAEQSVRIAFAPAPPEGAGWPGPLEDLERELALAAEAWSALSPRTPEAGGGPEPAGVEWFRRAAEEALAVTAYLRRIADRARTAGRVIAVPSPNRRALEGLGRLLRRTADEDGVRFWGAAVAQARAAREGGGAADTGDLAAAQGAAAARLERASAAARTLARAERTEDLLERTLALAADARGLLTLLPEASPGAAADAAAGATRRAQAILREAARVTAEILAGRSVSGGAAPLAPPAGELAVLANGLLEGTAPLTALDPVPGTAALRPAAERALAAMLPVAARLREKRDEEERAAALARTRLEPETAVAAEIAGLASALEAASAGAPRTQSAAAAILHRGSLALAALGEEIEAVEGREYADLETAAELHAARELLEDALAPALAGDAAAAGPAAARARELAAALHAGAPARRVGRAIQDLDFAAGGAEDLAWKLRGIRAGSHRALHTHLRAEREVLGLAKAAREGLVEYARGAGPTAPAPGGAAWAADLERLLQPLADAEAAAREAAHALAEKAAISGPEGEAAIALAAGASGRAARALGEAVEALERFRSVSFPEAAAARARLRSELGTLPERIARLAVRERAHARRVEAAALAAAGGGTGAAGSAGGDPQILLAEHEELRAAVADLAPRLKADGDRLLAAAAPVESLRLRDRAAARLAAAAADPMAAASRALKEAAAARPDEAARGARLLEAAGREEEAASELEAVAAALAALDLDAALDAVEGELANARPESGRRPQADEPPDLARITRDARHLLAGTQRAAETLSAKAAGVPAARALEALRRAAELFRGALDAAAREDAPAAAAALRAGLERLDDAIAAVRELRGASAPELAAAREALGKGEGAEAENAAPGKSSRELEAAYDELDKILKIQTLERELAGKLEELAGKQPDPEGLREAQEKARDLAKEMDDRFLTGEELVELVAKLIAVEREGRGAAELARELAAGAARTEAGAPGGLPADELAARRGGLVDRARKSARDFQEAGFKLSGALPHVLRAYWQGLEASQEMLRAVEEAVERSAAGPGGSGRGEGTGATAPAPGAPAAPIVPSRALLAAGSKVEAFLGRVDAMRHEALQAIADLERGGDGPNAAQAGLEQARRSAREAAQLLEAGDRDAAGRAAQAGSRSLADAARAVRSRMAGTLLPGGAEGSLMSRVLDEEAARLGLAWRVLTRGQELEGAERNPATDDMPFPSEFRELVRLYMQALREGRSP